MLLSRMRITKEVSAVGIWEAERMPPDPRFHRLMELGKQQGGLTPNDLHQVLDVERLSTDELSDMLVRLEQAGVSVEIDPALLAPASRRAD